MILSAGVALGWWNLDYGPVSLLPKQAGQGGSALFCLSYKEQRYIDLEAEALGYFIRGSIKL